MKLNFYCYSVILCLCCFSSSLKAQTPLVKQWDQRYAGRWGDLFTTMLNTDDGGYIFLGTSHSDSLACEKSESNRDTSYATYRGDFWIVKTDSAGTMQWNRTYGAATIEVLTAVLLCNDDNYLLAGYSNSDISGEKSQLNNDTSLLVANRNDYWLLKIDPSGNKIWDKRFGGNRPDVLTCIVKDHSNGFLLGGNSFSDSSGDKTQNNWNPSNSDWWIVKIDSNGNKEWDKRFGGTDIDDLRSIVLTDDGGYLLGGFSKSDSSGDKSQNNWSFGFEDFWLVKIDSAGNKQWDKRLGGNYIDALYSMEKVDDGGYLLAGISNSDSTGDKSQPHWGTSGMTDFWVIKIDGAGNKLWDKRYGGLDSESELCNIVTTSDKHFLLCGTSYSDIGGDKTANNLGIEQLWVVNIDSIGNKYWDKTILTDKHEEQCIGLLSHEGCYVFGTTTSANIAGDKTVDECFSSHDFWVIKYCDSTLTTTTPEIRNEIQYIKVNPNPFTESILISVHKSLIKNVSVTIFNSLGQEVFNLKENCIGDDFNKLLDLSQFSQGLYVMHLAIDDDLKSIKILKSP